jgi:hypothetical protein
MIMNAIIIKYRVHEDPSEFGRILACHMAPWDAAIPHYGYGFAYAKFYITGSLIDGWINAAVFMNSYQLFQYTPNVQAKLDRLLSLLPGATMPVNPEAAIATQLLS